jgi:hypothetical protein
MISAIVIYDAKQDMMSILGQHRGSGPDLYDQPL